jgi:photosystem II stability/assembly factor-like uncharacterized protein
MSPSRLYAAVLLIGFGACKTMSSQERDAPTRALPRLPATATWQKLDTEAYKGKQDDIFFIDRQTGWYGNGAGKIFKTVDAGKTWTLRFSKPGTFFRTLIFVDRMHGFAGNIGTDYFPGVTDETPLYETNDAGETWHPFEGVSGTPVKGLCAFQTLPEKIISSGQLVERRLVFAAGRVGGPAVLLRSLDGGKTFKAQSMAEHAAMLLDVHFFNARVGLLFAGSDADVQKSHGLILRTEDGGDTWKPVYQSTRPFELMWKSHFPSEAVGYATLQTYATTDAKNYIVKTLDGGKTWVELPLSDEPKVRQFGVGFLNPLEGFVGTTTGGYETRDGGATWTKTEFGKAVNRVRVVEDESGGWSVFAIGSEVWRLESSVRQP